MGNGDRRNMLVVAKSQVMAAMLKMGWESQARQTSVLRVDIQNYAGEFH
jgi:hypothetical protein